MSFRTLLARSTPAGSRKRVLATISSTALLATAVVLLAIHVAATPQAGGPGTRVVAWNNLGMHCMDSDFQVFSILPPYNTVDAQVIVGSKLAKAGSGVRVTYEAVADPTGSINTSSQGKTNFWSHVQELFGVALAVDMGLAGNAMPGNANIPQAATFQSAFNWFNSEGIPITPFDDAGHKNPYPMMRIAARDVNGNLLATTDVVLPVSDEMNCSSCHASGQPATKPTSGWVFNTNPDKDYRLNILKLHDDKNANDPKYAPALAANGYNAAGLYATVTTDHKAILCARCHLSEALPGSGIAGIPDLTKAIHGKHAAAKDPITGLTLDNLDNRASCYRCHPGSETKCLRGAMGKAVAPDGTLAMQCQSCHGNMSKVADPARTGWLQEPACQSCHTGTAVQNNGQIRYTTVFEPNGTERVAVNQTFATNPNVPVPGSSLYRFSFGHGGLACEACHGSTHAEYPSFHYSDNVQNQQMQGHSGMLVECGSCHAVVPSSATGGPHGMHRLGQSWVNGHGDYVQTVGTAACRDCHGLDYRGTVLSYSQADRTLSTKYGSKTFWRGYQVGCYACHNGPNTDNASPNTAPTAQNKTLTTNVDLPAAVALAATDPNGNPLTYRIVSQPEHGTVALAGSAATYFPDKGFAGGDLFTYAAWDGSANSNLATVSVSVLAPGTPIGLTKYGVGTAGCDGSHDLNGNASPKVGSPYFALVATNAPPVSLGLGVVTDSQDLLGSDPFGIGVTLYVDFFAATEVLSLDFVSDSTGHATAAAPVPNSPLLVGKSYYGQAIFVWIWPCVLPPLNLSSSNGLTITLQP